MASTQFAFINQIKSQNLSLREASDQAKLWTAVQAVGNPRLFQSKHKVVKIVELMYNHPLSRPGPHHADVAKYFSIKQDETLLAKYCQPALSTWAFWLVLHEIIAQAHYLVLPKAGLRV
ncbi:hypothetical protein OF83DRAFT_1175663 [Amylostereum chailletii]|nr:hypothetical protein OF83DRAFT_1175663 [Amylostereum chailletii]